METRSLQRKKVFDGVQRLIHAWVGLSVLALIILGWVGKSIDPGPFKVPLVQAHIILGYSLTVGLVLRIFWGLIGPEEARLSRLWPRRSLKKVEGWGHEPMASLSYLLFYAILLLAIFSGLMLAAMQNDRGPLASALFDDFTFHEAAYILHEWILYLTSAFVVCHIGALIFHERERGYPLAQAMLSGYQYRTTKQEKPNHE